MPVITETAKAILRENAATIARKEAASMSAWANYHPNIVDAAARYAQLHGLVDSDPVAFRTQFDNDLNAMRWAWIEAFCEKWGIAVPTIKEEK